MLFSNEGSSDWGVCIQQEVLQVQVESDAERAAWSTQCTREKYMVWEKRVHRFPHLQLSYQKTHQRLPGAENINISFPRVFFLFEQLLFHFQSWPKKTRVLYTDGRFRSTKRWDSLFSQEEILMLSEGLYQASRFCDFAKWWAWHW